MSEELTHTSDRRAILRGGLALAALPVAGALLSTPAMAAPAEKDLTLGWSFISKRPEVTPTKLLQDYENRHAVGAVPIFAKLGIIHYERNYVRRAVGTKPAFDVISEFGSRPGATRPNMCGKPNDPNWTSTHVMEVRETLVAGAPLPFLQGPVLKRAILLRRPIDASPERFANGALEFATETARQLDAMCHRISLYMQSGPIEDILACKPVGSVCEAALMLWPTDRADLPDSLGAPGTVAITSLIDLEAFASMV